MTPKAAPTDPSKPGELQTGKPAKRVLPIITAMAAVFAVLGVLRLIVGSTGVGWHSVKDPIFQLRLIHLEVASVVGVALSVSGVALQTLLRNPLAEPFILGLSTGAGVGIMLQLQLGNVLHTTLGPTYIGALAGALLSMAIVFLASRRRGVIDPLGLLLIGVVLGTINGAIIMFLNYVAGPAGFRQDLAIWMMGYIKEGVSEEIVCTIGGLRVNVIAVGAIITVLGTGVLVHLGSAMDVATFSDVEAESLGVNLGRLRTILFVVASVLAASAVAMAGSIAFVGLICPHLARLLLGPSHRTLLIGSAILGGSLLVLADLASTSLHLCFRWGLMPLGIFTAVLGGISFLWMLRPNLGRA